LLKELDLLTEETLTVLTSRNLCNSKFGFLYPILQEVSTDGKVPIEMFMDSTKHRRYYPDIFKLDERRFIVCNDWYFGKVRDNRTPFIHWLIGKIK